jgi:hypothetical protein
MLWLGCGFLTCRDNQEWKSRKRALPTQTASITEGWRARCGNSLVNFVFRERGKSYLRLLCGTNGEHQLEAHRPSQTRICISLGEPPPHCRRPITLSRVVALGKGEELRSALWPESQRAREPEGGGGDAGITGCAGSSGGPAFFPQGAC